MNNFLAIYKRDNLEIDLSELSDYLVAEPTETQIWKSKDKRVLFVSYTVRPQTKTNSFISDDDSVLTFEGFPLLDTLDEKKHKKGKQGGCVLEKDDSYASTLLEAFKSNGSQIFDNILGEYCAAAYAKGILNVAANLGGSHGIYYTANKNLVAFSNRSPLLLKLPYVSDELDTQSSAWKCYQGYVTGTRTAFKDIKKLAAGSVISVDSELQLHEKKTLYKDLNQREIREAFDKNPIKSFEKLYDNICDYLHRLKTHYPDLKFDMPLSGGKDSRLILSFLLKAGLKDQIGAIWTRGTLYSPDVIASQELCKQLGLPEPTIRRPKPISRSTVSARLIVNSTNYLEGNLSLYDFQGISNEKHITMRGHQNALRDGSFTKCRTDTLNHFLKDAVTARMSDPFNILNKAYSKKTIQEYKDFFEDCVTKENVPLHDLGDMYYLRDRNISWVALYCNSDYYSGPVSNPLLLGNLFNFAFSIPYEARSHELFHYLGIKYCAPKCLNTPFANQSWRSGIKIILEKMGDSSKVVIPTPFKSHKSFPDVANPYVSSIKVEYFNTLKPFMISLIKKHRNDLNQFMDSDTFIKKLNEIDQPQFRELSCGLGVYSDLILREYGIEIFNRKTNTQIVDDINANITITNENELKNGEKTPSTDEIYTDIIKRHEKCISSLVKEIQEHDSKQNLADNIQTKPSQGASNEITNKSTIYSKLKNLLTSYK